MSDTFQYLEESAIDETRTKKLSLPIRGGAVLIVAPATFDNRDYKRAFMAAPPRRRSAGERAKMTEAGRDADDLQYELALADLFARTVVRGWDLGPMNDAGARSAYDVDNCRAFLQSLVERAHWLWETIFNYCRDRTEWITIPEVAAVEDAKNSDGA